MQPAATILLVEDHLPTRTFLCDNLTADSYNVFEAGTVDEAMFLIGSEYPDLAIVDLGLPDQSGLELLRQIRSSDRLAGHLDPDLPLLVLSGRTTEVDRVRGFSCGADDYVTKPFSYNELRARIAALLWRTRRRPSHRRLRVGPLELDPIERSVWLHGEPVHLSKKEFALVRALASEPARVFTREELLRGVWGFRTICATRTLDSHACRLRKKLNAYGDGFVVNVWGVGYRLIDGEIE